MSDKWGDNSDDLIDEMLDAFRDRVWDQLDRLPDVVITIVLTTVLANHVVATHDNAEAAETWFRQMTEMICKDMKKAFEETAADRENHLRGMH